MSGIHQMLLSVGGPLISLPSTIDATDTAFDPDTATAAVAVRDDGTITQNPVPGFIHNWCDPTDQVADYLDYEFRLSKTSGDDTTTGSALATWIAASLNPSWTMNRGTNGISQFVGTLEVRFPSGATIDSCPVTITAEREP